MKALQPPLGTAAEVRDGPADLPRADPRLTLPSSRRGRGAGSRRLAGWDLADLRSPRAKGPARSDDAPDRYRSNDSIVAQRQRGEMPLGQWNAGDLQSMRDHRPGIEIERQAAALRNQQTLSARLARGEQPLEAPEGRSIVRPDGTDTAA